MGADSETEKAIESIASNPTLRIEVTKEDKDILLRVINTHLIVMFASYPKRTHYLTTDYGPTGKLEEELSKRNLLNKFSEILPWKTKMKITKSKILVCGQAREFIEI